jgi:hypothetical protein
MGALPYTHSGRIALAWLARACLLCVTTHHGSCLEDGLHPPLPASSLLCLVAPTTLPCTRTEACRTIVLTLLAACFARRLGLGPGLSLFGQGRGKEREGHQCHFFCFSISYFIFNSLNQIWCNGV